ncbi:MAG TPA: DUF3450 domain-containing protein [Parvularculaceae bacterium]|nr:DUF3450 domain-containing protein [Parvularculaceae bacterium]HRX38972.1 DUF3450 domain-containing protein [Parvularculaceae bacterium]
MKSVSMFVSAAALLAAIGAPAYAQFSTALDTSQQTANEGKTSQQRIDQLDDQTAALLNDYRANLKQLEAARRYNESLERNIQGQQRAIDRVKVDIENVAGLQRAVTPLMEDMLARLGDIVEADVPFSIDERRERVTRLTEVMSDPDVTVAQRYRLIVEAYQIENEYGRTIGEYSGSIDDGGEQRAGEFLRVGRLALIFKTGDDSVLKIWDNAQRAWVDLPKSYLPDVRLGLRMAKEQTAPALLPVPVKAPTKAAQ